jgi:CMP-N-acetylneuraminic acid synthetase
LIVHTIEVARQVAAIDRVVVSTDSDEIAAVAIEAGAEVPWRRPEELASDTASGYSVVRHALAACEEEEGRPYDAVVYLQPTSPLRRAGDVERGLRLLAEEGVGVVVGVCPLEHPLAWCVVVDDGGRITPHPAAGGGEYARGRQAHAVVHRLSGAFYGYRAEVVRANAAPPIEGARALTMPRERSLDIDTEADMTIASAWLDGGLNRPRAAR